MNEIVEDVPKEGSKKGEKKMPHHPRGFSGMWIDQKVIFELRDGLEIEGTIKDWSRYELLVDCGGKELIVFKSAIITMQIKGKPKPIKIDEEEKYREQEEIKELKGELAKANKTIEGLWKNLQMMRSMKEQEGEK